LQVEGIWMTNVNKREKTYALLGTIFPLSNILIISAKQNESTALSKFKSVDQRVNDLVQIFRTRSDYERKRNESKTGPFWT